MKIEIPEVKKLAYEMRIAMRWGDMDAMGHNNNTVYCRSMVIEYTLAQGLARGLVSFAHSEERCSSRKVNEARGTEA